VEKSPEDPRSALTGGEISVLIVGIIAMDKVDDPVPPIRVILIQP
jgi:hypothetical protein